MIAIGVAVSATLTASVPASADVGVTGLSRTVARPGNQVEIKVACGGCDADSEFPISIVPYSRFPRPFVCRKYREGLCTPRSERPPGQSPYVFLGRTETVPALAGKERVLAESRLIFEVPKVDSGHYVFVIFCGACVQGPMGSLITSLGTGRGTLWIRPGKEAARETEKHFWERLWQWIF